jgi:hypothetical protein
MNARIAARNSLSAITGNRTWKRMRQVKHLPAPHVVPHVPEKAISNDIRKRTSAAKPLRVVESWKTVRFGDVGKVSTGPIYFVTTISPKRARSVLQPRTRRSRHKLTAHEFSSFQALPHQPQLIVLVVPINYVEYTVELTVAVFFRTVSHSFLSFLWNGQEGVSRPEPILSRF